MEKVSASAEHEEVSTTPKSFSLFRNKKVQDVKMASESMEQLSSFRYKEKPIACIRSVSEDKAWITYGFDEEITLMTIRGHPYDSVPKQTTNTVFDVLDDKYFINVDPQKQVVLRIDHSGKMTNIMDTTPLFSSFVGNALSGNILITLVDDMTYTRTTNSQRKAVMLTPGGKVINTYEFGDDGTTPVFTAPTRLTQNNNSNVCVCNQYEVDTNKIRGNVCVFYEDGGLKFVYSGHEADFNPRDICCDPLCNIICVNTLTNYYSVHVIDSEGTFLKYLFTKDTCIPRPRSIALYRDVLWVGSATGEVRVYHYKQY